MAFYQNPFSREFQGFWVLGDRQMGLTFRCPVNTGRGDDLVRSYGTAPFDLSGNDDAGNDKGTLTLSFAINPSLNQFHELAIDVSDSAASGTAVTVKEIVDNLNNNTTFASYFTATAYPLVGGDKTHFEIRTKRDSTKIRFFVRNIGAETVLKINKFAGVVEMPTYFSRHTIENVANFDDCNSAIIELDTSDAVDQDVINNAVDSKGVSLGYDYTDEQEDWQLLKGRSGIFTFQKITVDGDDRIEEIIEYPAGAVAGDLARKIAYTYTGANTRPSQITEIPYVLESGDLVTP